MGREPGTSPENANDDALTTPLASQGASAGRRPSFQRVRQLLFAVWCVFGARYTAASGVLCWAVAVVCSHPPRGTAACQPLKGL